MRAITKNNMNSELNPEAPEFIPETPEFHQGLVADTQAGYQKIQKSIKASNSLPTGASYERFKIYTDFNVVKSQLSKNVLYQSNTILATELQTLMFKSHDPEVNDDKILENNDSILDRTNTNIDVASGVRKNTEDEGTGSLPSVSPWNLNPIITKIEVNSAVLFGAKNILRPQLNFKEPIDNGTSLWVPKISDKPNNIAPLALKILFNDDQVPIGYEHPYKLELDLYKPPAAFTDEPPSPIFPPPLERTKFTYIETEEQLDKLVTHLLGCTEIAVDMEHHSYRSYQGITCLIQLSTNEGGDFIIDALAARDHIHKLNLIFTDPKKLKVFHGASCDIVWLQRDFGVYVVGLFDTFQAARMLNFTGLSLKHLLMRYCQVEADKRYQLADWRIRPLPDELIKYARLDTHYLLYISQRMRFDLLHAAGGNDNLLMAAFEQSRQTCLLNYNKEVVDENSHLSMYVKSKKSFNSQQLTALQSLYKWRDDQARMLDESTAYLLPNHMLLALAEALPREVQGVDAICCPMPPFVKQNIITLHRIILSCRAMPLEPQLHPMPSSINTMLNHQQTSEFVVHDLFHFPEFSEDSPQLQIDYKNRLMAVNGSSPPETNNLLHSVYHSADIKVSDLNVSAKCFSPPYTRYKKYRILAQNEELEEFKEDQTKAISVNKNNEDDISSNLQSTASNNNDDIKSDASTTQRKRKISSDIEESKTNSNKLTNSSKLKHDKININRKIREKLIAKDNGKRYEYSKANLKKFYDPDVKSKKPIKQKNKTGYKKHKDHKGK